jgi:hypothetical protein
MKMAEENGSIVVEVGKRGRGRDRVQKRRGELQQQAPGPGAGQAARCSERGEASIPSTIGSSSKIISR